ncbi:MAG: dienelactone hydrolase family protein [Gemmatimonadetes bacterium]|nr:dienelactone hydrolase family protein [Gemmatimonadota bacterium]
MTDDPHRGSEEVRFGPGLEEAESAVVLIHGRGDSARGILALAPELQAPQTAFLAPQATGFSWYPNSFLTEVELNEPWLSSALERIEAAVTAVTTTIPKERVVLMGFSQGACLVLEFAARNTQRYGGVVAFSGGLIGPDGTPRDYPGSLEGTPVFLGCSDVDPHIPVGRVHESAHVMNGLGGEVEERIYPGMGHTINEDEIAWASRLLTSIGAEGS